MGNGMNHSPRGANGENLPLPIDILDINLSFFCSSLIVPQKQEKCNKKRRPFGAALFVD
jgi:hypothetical protein